MKDRKEYHAKYQKAHPEQCRAYAKAHYERNRAEILRKAKVKRELLRLDPSRVERIRIQKRDSKRRIRAAMAIS